MISEKRIHESFLHGRAHKLSDSISSKTLHAIFKGDPDILELYNPIYQEHVMFSHYTVEMPFYSVSFVTRDMAQDWYYVVQVRDETTGDGVPITDERFAAYYMHHFFTTAYKES